MSLQYNHEQEKVTATIKRLGKDNAIRVLETAGIFTAGGLRKAKQVVSNLCEGNVKMSLSSDDLAMYVSAFSEMQEIPRTDLSAGGISQILESMNMGVHPVISKSIVEQVNKRLMLLEEQYPAFDHKDEETHDLYEGEAFMKFMEIMHETADTITKAKATALKRVREHAHAMSIHESDSIIDKAKRIIYDTFDNSSLELAYGYIFNRRADDVQKMKDEIYKWLQDNPYDPKRDVIFGSYIKENETESKSMDDLKAMFDDETSASFGDGIYEPCLRKGKDGVLYSIVPTGSEDYCVYAGVSESINESDEVKDMIVDVVSNVYPSQVTLKRDELESLVKSRLGISLEGSNYVDVLNGLYARNITVED